MTKSREQNKQVSIFCGWGRVLFAQTYDDPERIAKQLQAEASGQRDIAAYVSDPHVVLSFAPQHLFLDPSDMMRLDLQGLQKAESSSFYEVRRPLGEAEARAINDLYLKRGMVPTDVEFVDAQD